MLFSSIETVFNMKLIFEITQVQFDEYKKFVGHNIGQDFYTQNKLKRYENVSNKANSPKRKQLFDKLKTLLNPFNLHVSERNLADKTVVRGLIRGFMYDKEKRIYSYSTQNANVYGVFKRDEKYFLFYVGEENLLVRLPFLFELDKNNAEPDEFESDIKGDKRQWRELSLIPLMLNKEKAINYFCDKQIDVGLRANEQTVWDHWINDSSFFADFNAKRLSKQSSEK